jgi:hypothetical protein
VERPSNRTETGVTQEPILLFGKKKEVSTRLSLRQTLVDQLDGDEVFILREEPCRPDMPIYCLPIRRTHLLTIGVLSFFIMHGEDLLGI